MNIDAVEPLVNLFLFLFSSLGASAVGNILREKTRRLQEREQRTESLFYFNRNVSFAENTEEVVETVGRSLHNMLDIQILIAMPDPNSNNELRIVYPENLPTELTPATKDAMLKCWKDEISTGHYTRHHPNADSYWVLMATALKKVGMIGYCGNKASLLPDRRQFKIALASQAAIAIERTQMLDISRKALVAEEREKLRSALLSSVSHDLKTPLASIIGSLSAIKQFGSALSKEDMTELNSNALDEAERLHNFINNILSMSRMESGSIKLNNNWISGQEITQETLKKLKRIQETHNVVLDESLTRYAFWLDIRLIQQVLQNLVDNAAKYSSSGSRITIGCTLGKHKKRCALYVRDEGKGIPESELPRIFDKFTRLEKRDKQIAGTGLGLSIVKTLTEAHEGTVEIINNSSLEKSAKGITFMLWFREGRFKVIDDIDKKETE